MDYPIENIAQYKEYLKNIALLSKLFSESSVPYVHYRTTEYLYCKMFGAKNISRSDVTIDAQKDNIGVGIKTFTYTGKKSLEKIAEFNSALSLFGHLEDLEKVKEISKLRNERIELVERDFRVDHTIYHCIGRKDGNLFVFEVPMNKIKIDKIKILSTKKSKNVINFNDGVENYSFNKSKSTLYKYFESTRENTILELDVNMLSDPLESIKKLVDDQKLLRPITETRVVLPLYGTKKGENIVHEKSGLNLWRASEKKRKRKYGEVEIRILSEFKDKIISALPKSDKSFIALKPNGDEIMLKICQQGDKALMSNPGTDLGLWLLRDVMGLEENVPLTYKRLVELDIDSIELTKIDNVWYINFCKSGTFDKFLKENS